MGSVDSPTAVSIFLSPSVGTTKGRVLVLRLEAIPSHPHPHGGLVSPKGGCLMWHPTKPLKGTPLLEFQGHYTAQPTLYFPANVYMSQEAGSLACLAPPPNQRNLYLHESSSGIHKPYVIALCGAVCNDPQSAFMCSPPSLSKTLTSVCCYIRCNRKAYIFTFKTKNVHLLNIYVCPLYPIFLPRAANIILLSFILS